MHGIEVGVDGEMVSPGEVFEEGNANDRVDEEEKKEESPKPNIGETSGKKDEPIPKEGDRQAEEQESKNMILNAQIKAFGEEIGELKFKILSGSNDVDGLTNLK